MVGQELCNISFTKIHKNVPKIFWGGYLFLNHPVQIHIYFNLTLHGGIVFSSLHLYVFVDTITVEPCEVSAFKFYGSKTWSEARTS